MSRMQPDPFPRGVLLGAGLLVTFALAAATTARLEGPGIATATPSDARVDAVRELRFQDRADGAVVVLDAGSGATVDVLSVATNGFVRASLRGLARERRREDQGGGAPFRLTRWSDGRVTLDDEATGRHVELVAFGANQVAAFARFLSAPTLQVTQK
jgi:putative photosynthetic complex assembly protein